MSGLHEHHRQLRRGGDERAVNKMLVGAVVHQWIHDHPAEAKQLGWIVSQYDDPADISITIPDTIFAEEYKPPRKPRETPRTRATLSFRIPNDRLEKGAEAFEVLWNDAVVILTSGEEGVSADGATGKFAVLMAVFHDFVQSHRHLLK